MNDHSDGAEALTAFLHLYGYDAQFVLSGFDVMRAIANRPTEIALVDINMPGMNGFEVARQVRQDPRTSDMLIVAFTSQDELAIRTVAISSGFDGYCRKGSAPSLLLDLLEQMTR
ncbi:response regulator [Paraburkholderia hospita]|uniref:response regulator n=1 Tax=Paraburkholderia hospita TaxID=169430 RepID=UPI001EEF7177|nr:response regulator [Paraburkholderia hospita]